LYAFGESISVISEDTQSDVRIRVYIAPEPITGPYS